MRKKVVILLSMAALLVFIGTAPALYAQEYSSIPRDKAIRIGGGAAAGAVLGGLLGGGKGALAGAIAGGAGGAIYDHASNSRDSYRSGRDKAVIIGGSAGAGAVAGGIAGGRKGALIGAAIGGAGGYVLHKKTENRYPR